MTLTLSVYCHDTTVVAVYAPTEDSTQQLKDNFYNSLTETIEAIPRHQEIVISGDINARVGWKIEHEVVGQFGEECLNSSGEMLIEFCPQNALKILNGFFEHKIIHRFSWERPSLQQKSILDYFIVKQAGRLRWQDCRVKRGSNCGSDHYMVEAKLICPYGKKETKQHQETEERPKVVEEQRYKLYNKKASDTCIKTDWQKNSATARLMRT